MLEIAFYHLTSMKTLNLPSKLRGVNIVSLVENVPYYSQLDNHLEPYRTCNVSACAMAIAAIYPGLFNSDDQYAQALRKYGDTTDHTAHTRMLESQGVRSQFRTNLDYGNLSESLSKDKPVVIGVLHRGTLFNPTGGHMITIIGQYDDGFIAHDPFGKPFSYSSTDGAYCLLPYQSLNKRWLVEGASSGWGRIFL